MATPEATQKARANVVQVLINSGFTVNGRLTGKSIVVTHSTQDTFPHDLNAVLTREHWEVISTIGNFKAEKAREFSGVRIFWVRA